LKKEAITLQIREQKIRLGHLIAVRFLQYQKERVEKEEITGATLRHFIKAIK
jgi:hypothetical protein